MRGHVIGALRRASGIKQLVWIALPFEQSLRIAGVGLLEWNHVVSSGSLADLNLPRRQRLQHFSNGPRIALVFAVHRGDHRTDHGTPGSGPCYLMLRDL